MLDLTGTRLGHYEVAERLGMGGMAVVYRAIQQPLGREVALKVLSPSLVDEAGFQQRFENEARALASLDHPNILPIFDFDRIDGMVYITMPLVRGGSLRDLMDRGPMVPSVAWRYLRETGDALHHAHEAGIVHRDLKPSNVLIHSDGRALLADFGLARADAQPMQLTTVGFAVGTPGYMAPEQVMGRPLDRRADIYAMGVLVFEMLTGRMPFAGGNPMEVAYATVNEPIPSACALNPNLPDQLDQALARILAKDPDDRPQTMKAVVAELGRLPQRRVTSVTALPPATLPLTPPGGSSVVLRAATSATPIPGSAIATLEQMGIKRLVGTQRVSLNSHWANNVHVAREVAGARWPEVVQAAGIPDILDDDPISNEERTNPIDNLSKLNEAFDVVFGVQAPEMVKQWGRLATDRSLAIRRGGAGQHRAFKLIPGQQRKLGILLKAFTESMDEVRGEHTHTWRQIDERQFWLVHFTNLYAYGRIKLEKSCHVWTASFESMLRWAGLANDWYVEEIECGTVTGTFDCVFRIRSVKPDG